MDCLGVVLAGGKSSRMGEDKALLKLENGQTLLQSSIQILKDSGIENIVISGDRPNGISDRIKNLGPLAAIETIIHKTQAERLLIIPVDMPLLNCKLLKLLLQDNHDESIYFQEHYLPLKLIVTKKTKMIIRQLLEQQDRRQRSIKNLLKEIPTKILKIKKTQFFSLQNINTPEQWQKLNKVELKNVS